MLTEEMIASNLEALQKKISIACKKSGRSPEDIKLIAVTKNVGAEDVAIAYKYGIRDFGENRLQEAKGKYSLNQEITNNCTLHFIGHLQTNKSGEVCSLFDIIHSVDSIRLAYVINESALKRIRILLQVNIAGESTKYGFSPLEIIGAVNNLRKLPNLDVCGLMTIAPWTRDSELLRSVFSELRHIKEITGLKELSMGMTDDFELAIEEGSTMLRIGRAIFGERSK